MSHPSFHLSLTVLVHYRSQGVFSLGEWPPLIPAGYLPHGTWDIAQGALSFAYKTFTFFGCPFQSILLPQALPTYVPQLPALLLNLGCSAFARRYLRNLFDFFSTGYLDVSVLRVPPHALHEKIRNPKFEILNNI